MPAAPGPASVAVAPGGVASVPGGLRGGAGGTPDSGVSGVTGEALHPNGPVPVAVAAGRRWRWNRPVRRRCRWGSRPRPRNVVGAGWSASRRLRRRSGPRKRAVSRRRPPDPRPRARTPCLKRSEPSTSSASAGGGTDFRVDLGVARRLKPGLPRDIGCLWRDGVPVRGGGRRRTQVRRGGAGLRGRFDDPPARLFVDDRRPGAVGGCTVGAERGLRGSGVGDQSRCFVPEASPWARPVVACRSSVSSLAASPLREKLRSRTSST